MSEPLTDAHQALRDRLTTAIYTEGAYCGDCEYEGWDTCADCRKVVRSYADAVLALLDEPTLHGLLGLRQVGLACFDGRHDGIAPKYGRIGVVCALDHQHTAPGHVPVYVKEAPRG